MNVFLLLWSLTGPVCLAIVYWILKELGWRPFDPSEFFRSIANYSIYWVLLAALQGLLLSRFNYKNLGRKWFITTGATGFLIMICHELFPRIIGVDTRGQGVIFVIFFTLPFLVIFGGLILGSTQFLILRSYTNGRK